MGLRWLLARTILPRTKILHFTEDRVESHGGFGRRVAVSRNLLLRCKVFDGSAALRFGHVRILEPGGGGLCRDEAGEGGPHPEGPSIARLEIGVPNPAVTGDFCEGLTPPATVGPNRLCAFHPPEIHGFLCRRRRGKPPGTRREAAAPLRFKPRPNTSGATALRLLLMPVLVPSLGVDALPLDPEAARRLDLPAPLYGFQVEGVRRLVENTSFLLGDEMGTGKTVMAIVAMKILFQRGLVRKALVACPANIISVWDEHLREWVRGALTWVVVKGPVDQRMYLWRQPAHVYVVSYDTLRNDLKAPPVAAPILSGLGLAILDEVHAIRNPRSGRHRAVMKLNPKYRWGLSGTPLQNRLRDLKAIFDFLKPGLFWPGLFGGRRGPRSAYLEEYVRGLMEPYFLRRRKRDVLPQLPEKVRQDLWLELDAAQRRAYEECRQRMKMEFESRITPFTRMHIFSYITKLMQYANFAPNKTVSPKQRLLVEMLEEITTEHKAVVFTQFIHYGINRLAPHLERFGLVVVHGQTPLEERRRAVEEFQKNPDVRVFLGSVKAAGEGITLHEGNYVIHFDHWWNPAVAWQAEDRVHRVGQRRQVNVYSYWMEDTIEERIYQVLRDKGLLHASVIERLSEDDIDRAITMEEWAAILGLELAVSPR